MSTPARPILRIAIIDRCVPLYRVGLYRVLMADPARTFTLIAAAKPIERIGTVPFPGPANWQWIDAPGVPIAGTHGRSVWQWGAVKAGLSRRFDAIIMMANPNDPSLWLSALLARITGKRLVFWTHGLTRRERGLRRFIRVRWLKLAHAYLIYGHLGKVGMLSEGFEPDRCHVCYNSLDYATQRQLRESIDPNERRNALEGLFGDRAALPLVVSVSRLNRFKKIDVLIRAHADLITRGAQNNVLIIGDGDDRPRLEALAEELAVGHSVRFFGECYDEHVLATLISGASVAVTPGAIGLTVMHSMAYGVPCITHDDPFDHGPEFEAIVKGVTGTFFRKDDARDLASVLEGWLSRNAAERQATREACIRHMERFYRPEVQAMVFDRAIAGLPADDLLVAGEETTTLPQT